MYLNANFSFNKSNAYHKSGSNGKNIILLKRNNLKQKNGKYVINSYNNIKEKEIVDTNENSSDISFYNTSLKNQILSPEDEDDIYQNGNLYNNNENINKKNESIHKYTDDIDCNFLSIKNINNSNYINENIYSNSRFPNEQNKKTLILDLDETLVHSSFQPLVMNKETIKPDIFFKIFFNNKYYDINVYKRPFLNKFLKEMKKIFIIYVFTASIEKYAQPLLDQLDTHNCITKKLYRESCTLSEGKYIKDLKSLNLKLNDVIILDNNPWSYKYNKKNGLPIKSWHFDKNDNELLKIIPLLKYLSTVNDVRKYIPYIVENDEINFNKISSLINPNNKRKSHSVDKKIVNNYQHKKMNLNKTINYNKYEEMKVNFLSNHCPETINFREPVPNKVSKMPIDNNKNQKNGNAQNQNKNFYYNYSFQSYKNDINRKNSNKRRNKSNSLSVVNFNSCINELDINLMENNNVNILRNKCNNKFDRSCNNFYINSKYSFVINQQQENDKNKEEFKDQYPYLNIDNNNIFNNNLYHNNNKIEENKQSNSNSINNNIINNNVNKSKLNKSNTNKIPFSNSRKNENKIELNIKIPRRILNNKKNSCKLYKKNYNYLYKNYESYENDYNTITPLIKLNDNYVQLRKNNTIEALGKNNVNSIRNIICYNSSNCINTLNNNNNVNNNINDIINNINNNININVNANSKPITKVNSAYNSNNNSKKNTINYEHNYDTTIDKKTATINDANIKNCNNCNINTKLFSNNIKHTRRNESHNNFNNLKNNSNTINTLNANTINNNESSSYFINKDEKKISKKSSNQKVLSERINKNFNLNDNKFNNNLFDNYSLKKEKINLEEKNCYVKRKMKLKNCLLNNKNICKENTKSNYCEEKYNNLNLIDDIPSSARIHTKKYNF